MAKCKNCSFEMGKGLFKVPPSTDDPELCISCATIVAEKDRIQNAAEKVEENINSIIVSTTPNLPAHRVTKYVGLVRGGTVRARHVGRDMIADLKNIVGGEIVSYTELLAEAREEAIYRMRQDADRIGANAVVGMSFSTSMIGQGIAEVYAFGTGVIAEADQDDLPT